MHGASITLLVTAVLYNHFPCSGAEGKMENKIHAYTIVLFHSNLSYIPAAYALALVISVEIRGKRIRLTS